MMIAMMLVAAMATTGEAELAAKLPEIFAKSAAHYKALDAAATPLITGKKGEMRTPHGFNRQTGKLDMRDIYWWTSGHFPGSLWYLYEATGNDAIKARAMAWTEMLAPVAKYDGNHDIGFMMYCSFGNARRILKTTKYDALLMEAAGTLTKRYNTKLGLIRSWGKLDETKNFRVIPDNLMNLELLAWAGAQKGGNRFADVARSHADVTMRHHFRVDGGCYHVLDYDQNTGRVQGIERGQGASCETAWSRGQSWGIYGYTMLYRIYGLNRYLDFAKKLADYAINHPNMPADGIPCWDYGAPGEERDSSAGAIMASALLELSQYVGAVDRLRYRAFAVKQLASLASPAYFSEGDEIGHFLLKHGVGHKPAQSEVDTPLDYGDYYFLEALVRFRRLTEGEATRVPIAAMLPPAAQLPADELAHRSRVGVTPAKIMAQAEKALVDPIPDTSDELYGEYWTTGNRSHYEKPFFVRLKNIDALAQAEKIEGKGRFLPRLEAYLAAICAMKSWVLPAHDTTDGGKGVLRGTCMLTDLFSSEVGAHLACIVQSVGDRLKPMTVARVKAEIERRVLTPVRHDIPNLDNPAAKRLQWWIDGANNWNAVCWDNVVCAACGILDSPADRALFVAAADKAADIYLKHGFAEDGYCSEGMGYWNYGYGHHLHMGVLLNNLTAGRFDFFRRPKQRLAAAYPRDYTLRKGVSPAFADGNGAVSATYLKMVDAIWPDLPKVLPAVSEFPDGQVWLVRTPGALSVAFKGGHNDEHHNHNDLGSYYIDDGTRFVAGDPGGEVYTARTFSSHRYDSKVLNSYGHPVPVVGGKLQMPGRRAAAKVLAKSLAGDVVTVVLDLTAAYDVQALKTLTRTFTYDRKAKTFAVCDHVVFAEPTAFEDCYVTHGEKANVAVRILKGGDATTREEVIENPGKPSPHRFAWAFSAPVKEAEIEFLFR